jgi:hypothetical protein
MIPVEQHKSVFQKAKRGSSIDFFINRVPKSHLNSYVGRTGKIRNIRLKKGTYKIEWIDVIVNSLGYGKCKLVSFPVEHITLITPSTKPTYTNYADYYTDTTKTSYTGYYADTDYDYTDWERYNHIMDATELDENVVSEQENEQENNQCEYGDCEMW